MHCKVQNHTILQHLRALWKELTAVTGEANTARETWKCILSNLESFLKIVTF